MWFFWVFALLPIAVGGVLWYRRPDQVIWKEWLGGAGCALLMAGLFQLLASIGMTSDVETWSGHITQTSHYGQWIEEYEQMHTRQVADGTNKDGDTTYRTEIYYTTEHATHYEKWTAHRDFGSYTDEEQVSRETYGEIYQRFGARINSTETQSTTHGGHYDGGDRNKYITLNNTGYIYPVTTTRRFENRVKAAPSLFSFSKVPTNIQVYPWPKNENWMASDRLLGTAPALIDPYKFDCLNSALGPIKRVNVIMVGFGTQGDDYAHYQQAKWIGGKKNDIVICFGGGTKESPADWSYVFGWSESELVKRNLQSLLIGRPINDDLLPAISEEIQKNYTIKDWKKFDYISIEPPTWSYWVYISVMVLAQGGLWFWFHINEFEDYTLRWKRG